MAALSGEQTGERHDGRRRTQALPASAVRRPGYERDGLGALGRLYARLGVGYIVVVLAWLGFLVLAGGMTAVVVAARLLGRSFRPPLELAVLVEAGIVVGCGIPFAFIWREARPLVSWIRNGRPQRTASDAWQTGVTLIRRALPRCYVLTVVLLIPAVAWVTVSITSGREVSS